MPAGRDLEAAILAAGLGRRLEPLTTHLLPKPMFPLGGVTPMVETWVQKLVAAGVTNISMNLCVLSQTIRRHFGDGEALGARLRFVEEDEPSGTLGGACKQAFAAGGGGASTLLVPSGDIVTNFDAELIGEMHDRHRKMGAACSMILVPVPWERRKDYGTVVLAGPERSPGRLSQAGPISGFFEKDPQSPSNLNNASIYLIEMDFLRRLDELRTPAEIGLDEPFYDFGKHVFPAMLDRIPWISLGGNYPLWGFEYDGLWFDVGQKRDYLRVNDEVLSGRLEVEIPYERRPWGWLGGGAELDESTLEITGPVVIGNQCLIGPGAQLGPNAVIGDGWTVGEGARIRDSVLWKNYPFYTEDGQEIPLAARRTTNPQRVKAGVSVEESILTGGAIDTDVRESTVQVLPDGELLVRPIDWIPDAPRA